MRKICYVSGTRADFGLMLTVLRFLQADPNIDLSLCVTGMHLSKSYGNTVQEIEREGFRICARIPVDVEKTTSASMVCAIGQEIVAMTEVFSKEKPDMVLLLGDRGEQLAAAIAAAHLNIHIGHIHGGERSGTVDEMVRHAVSKFSHYHFVATENSKERLIRMGEREDSIFVIGAPGLDQLKELNIPARNIICEQVGFDPKKPIGLFVFHPVVQEMETMAQQAQIMMKAALDCGLQWICLQPNSDAGGFKIREVLKTYEHNPNIKIYAHLERTQYLYWLGTVDLMLGNSSSGIIEAASFNLPVINVGQRQNLRERSGNVIDSLVNYETITDNIQTVLNTSKRKVNNIYGDGSASMRCHELLTTLPLSPELLSKCNAY
ncbi:MAG: UDP-N-acetylglucosamine 2-epimerase (hydrolyzing) [Proteobacteria bacterium]|nr:UDP-N-acetylglucosamine 2-epimerase (hydrolyzing) [Pseudomonadota bacterium]